MRPKACILCIWALIHLFPLSQQDSCTNGAEKEADAVIYLDSSAFNIFSSLGEKQADPCQTPHVGASDVQDCAGSNVRESPILTVVEREAPKESKPSEKGAECRDQPRDNRVILRPGAPIKTVTRANHIAPLERVSLRREIETLTIKTSIMIPMTDYVQTTITKARVETIGFTTIPLPSRPKHPKPGPQAVPRTPKKGCRKAQRKHRPPVSKAM